MTSYNQNTKNRKPGFKITSFETNNNSLEQYGCRNIETAGISDSIPNQNLEQRVMKILKEINVNVSPSDIEAHVII